MPVRSSIQSARFWPTSRVRDLILAIIQAPRLDHPRRTVGEIVLYVKTSVLADLVYETEEAVRGRPRAIAPVNVVLAPVARAYDQAPLRLPPRGAPQVGAVVAQDVYPPAQLLDLGRRKRPSTPVILHDIGELAVVPGDENGVDGAPHIRGNPFGPGLLFASGLSGIVGLFLGELHPVLYRRARGDLPDGSHLHPLVGNVRTPLKVGLDRGAKDVDGGRDGKHGPDQRPHYAHRQELAPGYRISL